ncbi:unnamed protein product, partial [Phaeothamnion confervicola]
MVFTPGGMRVPSPPPMPGGNRIPTSPPMPQGGRISMPPPMPCGNRVSTPPPMPPGMAVSPGGGGGAEPTSSSVAAVAAVAVAAVRLPRLLSTIGGTFGGGGGGRTARLSVDPEELLRHKLEDLIDELPNSQVSWLLCLSSFDLLKKRCTAVTRAFRPFISPAPALEIPVSRVAASNARFPNLPARCSKPRVLPSLSLPVSLVDWYRRPFISDTLSTFLQLLPAVLRICRGAAELMHSHYLMTQWHLSPFDERNEDDDWLYRCPITHGSAAATSAATPLRREASGSSTPGGGGKGGRGGKNGGNGKDGGSGGSGKHRQRLSGSAAAAAAAPAVVDEALRSQLSVLEESLRAQRAGLWARVERSLERLLTSASMRDGMGLEGLASLLGVLNVFVAVGEEFAGRASLPLRRCLADKAEQFFIGKHAEALQVLRQMVERELWQRVPVSLREMGGLEGLLKATARRFAVPDSAALRGVSPAWAEIASVAATATAGEPAETAATASGGEGGGGGCGGDGDGGALVVV